MDENTDDHDRAANRARMLPIVVFLGCAGLVAIGGIGLAGVVVVTFQVQDAQLRDAEAHRLREAGDAWARDRDEVMGRVTVFEGSFRNDPPAALQETRAIALRVNGARAAVSNVDQRRVVEVVAEIERVVAVQEGLRTAEAVVADPARCPIAAEVASAWPGMAQARPDDPEWKAAVAVTARLERCRGKAVKLLADLNLDLRVALRTATAQKIQTTFWDNGLNIKVTVTGAREDRMNMSFALFSEAMVYQLTKDGELVRTLEAGGFRKLVLADGFGTSWSWDLTPDAPDDADAKAEVERLGLAEPLRLTEIGPK